MRSQLSAQVTIRRAICVATAIQGTNQFAPPVSHRRPAPGPAPNRVAVHTPYLRQRRECSRNRAARRALRSDSRAPCHCTKRYSSYKPNGAAAHRLGTLAPLGHAWVLLAALRQDPQLGDDDFLLPLCRRPELGSLIS